jgi:hypothetical protein
MPALALLLVLPYQSNGRGVCAAGELPLTRKSPQMLVPLQRRGGRVAEGGGLLNRYTV